MFWMSRCADTPRVSPLGDFVIWLALLGAFAGLIAALTIASANIGIVQASEQAQSDQMRQFIEQLLATAATKFSISAVGIGSRCYFVSGNPAWIANLPH